MSICAGFHIHCIANSCFAINPGLMIPHAVLILAAYSSAEKISKVKKAWYCLAAQRIGHRFISQLM